MEGRVWRVPSGIRLVLLGMALFPGVVVLATFARSGDVLGTALAALSLAGGLIVLARLPLALRIEGHDLVLERPMGARAIPIGLVLAIRRERRAGVPRVAWPALMLEHSRGRVPLLLQRADVESLAGALLQRNPDIRVDLDWFQIRGLP